MKKFFAIFFVMMCVTITSFAGDLLTAAMFRNWTTSGADAVDNGAAGCNYKINDQSASDGLPYGDGNVYYLNFADLTAYSTLEIEFTEGTPRLLFNRLVDQGAVGVEINGAAGMEYVDATTAGKWIVDIAAITEAQGFAHLHCIKGANWANATVTRVELFKGVAPSPTFAVDSYVGNSYEGIDNAVSDEFAAVMVETLGLTGADGEMIEIGAVMPDGTVDWTNGNGRGETDGWRNVEGNWCAWGTDGFTFYSQPYAEFAEGQWYFGAYMGSAPGAITEPTSFETAFVFKANGKECTVVFTLNYIERPVINVEVQEEVDVPAFTYDFALGYAGAQGTYDTSMVEDAIGCTAAEAEVFGFNPSTEESVRGAMATFDGWHAANGDLQGWGEAPFCIKFYNDGTFWYCSMPDVAELGATYKTAWLLVNPNTGAAVQYNFTMNDISRKVVPNDQALTVDLYNVETKLVLGEDTRTVYGDKSIYAENYADLADWNYMTFKYTTGVPQFIFNRQGEQDHSNQYIQVLPTDETYMSKIEGTDMYCFDIAKFVADNNAAHLNIIRGLDFVPTNMNSIKLWHNNPAPGRLATDTDYYLYNEESGEWFGGANSWGTQASFVKHPQPVRLAYKEGEYTIDTYTTNGGVSHFLNIIDPTFFIDAAATGWNFLEIEGVYYLSCNGTFLGQKAYGGGTVIPRATERDVAAGWTLYTKAELEAKMLDPNDPFVDATFYAPVADFSRNQYDPATGANPWTKEAANCNISGGNNSNNLAESWRSSNGFNVYQKVNLPNGVYRVDAQASVVEYAEPKTGADLAVVYANYLTTPFCVSSQASTQEGGENSMSAVSESFTAGKYQVEPMYVMVTDGTLQIGVKSPRNDTWAVWDNFELTYVPEDVLQTPYADGEYYLYNEEADAWLGGANSWGTQASLIKHPQPFYISNQGGIVYQINSYTFNNANQHFLGSNGYVDSDATNWKVVQISGNKFALCFNNQFLGYDGSSTVLSTALTGAGVAGAQWTLVTKDELIARLADATEDNPVDATFYAQVPNFSRNQAYTTQGQSPWTAEAANKNLSGGDNTNNCAESWQSAFNIYQTMTNLPNGLYKVYAQAALTDYSGANDGANYPYIYANDNFAPFLDMVELPDAGRIPNSMSEMSQQFSLGNYAVDPILVLVEDGTLTIGAKGTRTDTWAIFDNFEIYYLGAAGSINELYPKYEIVSSDEVKIDYVKGTPVQSGDITKNYDELTGGVETYYAINANAGLETNLLRWYEYNDKDGVRVATNEYFFDEDGVVCQEVNAHVGVKVDNAAKKVFVKAFAPSTDPNEYATTEPRYHAYLVLANETTGKAVLLNVCINFVDRPDYVATAIEAVKANDADAKIFDLSGREVKKATNGVYIINGVKTLVK